jgi:hypothetical protein
MDALTAVRSLEDSLPSAGGALFSFEIAEGALLDTKGGPPSLRGPRVANSQ